MSALTVGGAAPESAFRRQHTNPAGGSSVSARAQVREVVTWKWSRSTSFDPTFGGALIAGQRNVFTTTADLTGIAFLTEPRISPRLVVRDCAWKPVAYRRRSGTWTTTFKVIAPTPTPCWINYHHWPVTMGGGDAVPANSHADGYIDRCTRQRCL